MKIQLVKVTRSRKGHPIRAEGTVDADSPVVGRGAHCAIHLSDPRVALEHASISGAAGACRISAIGTAALNVDGRRAGDLALTPGTQFEIGPYLLAVEEPPAGSDLALSYELVRPLPDGIDRDRRQVAVEPRRRGHVEAGAGVARVRRHRGAVPGAARTSTPRRR